MHINQSCNLIHLFKQSYIGVPDVMYEDPRSWSSIRIITVQRESCLRSFLSVQCVTSYVTFLQPGDLTITSMRTVVARTCYPHIIITHAANRHAGWVKKLRGPSKCQITFYDAGILGKRYVRAIQGRAPSDYTFAFSRRCVRIDTRARRSSGDRQAQPGLVMLTFWKFRNRNGSSRRAFDAIRYRRPTARRRFHRWPLKRFLMLFRKNNLMLRWKDPNLNHFSFFEITGNKPGDVQAERWEKSNTFWILLKILFPCYYFNFRDIWYINCTIIRILNLILFIFYYYDRQLYYPKLNFNLMKKATFRFSVKQLTLT